MVTAMDSPTYSAKTSLASKLIKEEARMFTKSLPKRIVAIVLS